MAGRVFLAEHEVLLGPLGRTPQGDPALQRAQHAVGIVAGMAALEFLQQGGGADVRDGAQDRQQIRVPDGGKGIFAGAPGAS